MPVETLAELFLHTAGHRKDAALLHKVAGRYRPVSTPELVDRVRRLARAFELLRIEPGDRIALMAENGPHWPVVDFATLTSGAVTAPIYPTLPGDQAAYIAADCGARIVFVQDRERLAELLAHRDELPTAELFVVIDPGADPEVDPAGPAGPAGGVTTLAELTARGGDVDVEAFGDRAHRVKPDDLATLVYTSGTTGKPKGVMLTHGNIVSNVLASLELFDIRPEHTALCFLPLAHAYERTIDYCYFHQGVTVAYAESVAALGENLQEVRPHSFVSVPRVYEKVLAKIRQGVAAKSPLQQKIFAWAEGVGAEALPHRLRRQHPPGLLGLQLAVADRLVFGKIRQSLGGRFLYAVSGGAPLGPDVARFFWGAGVEIYEGYGLTETSPVITANAPGAAKLGTVGKPIPGVEVTIAADGEILSRGPNTMRGYWGKPDATAEVLQDDGWFHTGDIGELDADGFLTITDRKKELIINAYGKNVAPAPIENALKASRFIEQAVVLGDKRKFLAALLVPDWAALNVWAEAHGVDISDRETALDGPQVEELFRGEVADVNAELAHYEEILAWDLLPHEMTQETGELTPTQKIKRRVIDQKHGDRIDRLYARAEAAHERTTTT